MINNFKWLGLISTVALLCCTGCGTNMNNYQTPQYSTQLRQNDFEIRLYKPELAVTGRDSDDNSAFRKLFKYIGGANNQSQKIPMTVPVRKKGVESENTLSFFVPKELADGNVPEPLDNRVLVEKYEEGIFAAVRFSGFPNDKKVTEKRLELINWAKQSGYQVDEEWYLDRYDPPWTLPFLRTNEILVRVEPAQSE